MNNAQGDDMSMAHVTLSFPARQYEDFDDCLAAAEEGYAAKHPEAAGYDMRPRWADDDCRTVILLDVPADSTAPIIAEALLMRRPKSGRGGARPGAGRPATVTDHCDVHVQFRLTSADMERAQTAATAAETSVPALAKRLLLDSLK